MNIIDKLKTLGVEITPEIEKAFPGEFVSDLEVQKKMIRLLPWKQRRKNSKRSRKLLKRNYRP